MEKILNDFNCCQKTFSSVADLLDLDEETILKIASGFGGGLQHGEVCGCVSGALMAIGLKLGSDDPTDEVARNLVSQTFEKYISDFRAKFGCVRCQELLGLDEYTPEAKNAAREAGRIAEVCPGLIAYAQQHLRELLEDA
ncbi:MAG: C_GCAxxG_C_C family protein [Oscillospiraceae bacterium]|nr:C_GCAxxG_C_C family protein [Oscillospiraceae bacterium]